MFRQDYRINKIFLPLQKKGKNHLEAMKTPVNPVNSVRKHFGFMSK
jgi:hypothetical protein